MSITRRKEDVKWAHACHEKGPFLRLLDASCSYLLLDMFASPRTRITTNRAKKGTICLYKAIRLHYSPIHHT